MPTPKRQMRGHAWAVGCSGTPMRQPPHSSISVASRRGAYCGKLPHSFILGRVGLAPWAPPH
eukprot:10619587-Alexandrium_andersonii.AAC.1